MDDEVRRILEERAERARIEGETLPASFGGYVLLVLSATPWIMAIGAAINTHGKNKYDLGAGLGGLVVVCMACFVAATLALVSAIGVKICGRGNRHLAKIALVVSGSYLGLAILIWLSTMATR